METEKMNNELKMLEGQLEDARKDYASSKTFNDVKAVTTQIVAAKLANDAKMVATLTEKRIALQAPFAAKRSVIQTKISAIRRNIKFSGIEEASAAFNKLTDEDLSNRIASIVKNRKDLKREERLLRSVIAKRATLSQFTALLDSVNPAQRASILAGLKE